MCIYIYNINLVELYSIIYATVSAGYIYFITLSFVSQISEYYLCVIKKKYHTADTLPQFFVIDF